MSDPLTYSSPPEICWTRSNMAEVTPGVIVPLGWSFYGPLTDISSRRGFAQLGAISEKDTSYPDDVAEHLIGVFHGRPVLNITTLRAIMSGFPGVSGDDVERDIAGSVRGGVVDRSYGWRLPAVAAKAGVALLGSGKAATMVLSETTAWWSTRFGPDGIVDGTPPRTALAEAVAHFGDAVVAQSRNRMIFQGASSQVVALAEKCGRPELASALLAAPGGLEEAAVADDLRALAADRLDLATFLSRHGFHGPNAGDITAQSWRENPAPIERLVKRLRDVPDEGPRRDDRTRAVAVESVLAAVPTWQRPAAKLALRLTPTAARSLERSKVAFVMSLDGARAAARAVGAELVDAGVLDRVDDVFFLFVEELLDATDRELRTLVADRRADNVRHQGLDMVANTWEGNPAMREITTAATSTVTEISGIGASPGTVEGRVRIVLDAGADTDVDIDDILVCSVTDPSWVSLMMLAGALVIDIGGTASHGAIVARELGVPCVIGTATGTTDLRDGDLVRVDGAAGVVTVLERAQ
ncbi:PEP-utilizing enzyme [Mycobacterium sp. SMC-8]|uniref:PEP-utilizing enzyme n=1 Tax=Mycobacterium sp. SMC-8 TaxID=2857060 RepID=UPI0028C42E9B|nr:PEP-utilizing enzyme [Mycobacterium sp. SMC-8]